jgi:hypothetical protein
VPSTHSQSSSPSYLSCRALLVFPGPPYLPCRALPVHHSEQNYTMAIVSEFYYRSANESLSVVECPVADVCVGNNNTAGDGLCGEGHQGPFCMICKIDSTARYVWIEGKCERCSPASEATLYAVCAVFGLLCVGCVFFIARTETKKTKIKSEKRSRFDTERLEAFAGKFQTKVPSFFQFPVLPFHAATTHPHTPAISSSPLSFVPRSAHSAKFLPSFLLLECVHFRSLAVALAVVPIPLSTI